MQARRLAGARVGSPWSAGSHPLTYRPRDIFTKALDLGQDGFGGSYPQEGTGSGVVVLHKGIDCAGAFSHVVERTASNGFLGNDAKPGFHLMDP